MAKVYSVDKPKEEAMIGDYIRDEENVLYIVVISAGMRASVNLETGVLTPLLVDKITENLGNSVEVEIHY